MSSLASTNYLSRLGSAEVQTCMHFLSAYDILFFARCNKQLYNDASSKHAFKYARPITIYENDDPHQGIGIMSGLIKNCHSIYLNCTSFGYTHNFEHRSENTKGLILEKSRDNENYIIEDSLCQHISMGYLVHIEIAHGIFTSSELTKIYKEMAKCRALTTIVIPYSNSKATPFCDIANILLNNPIKVIDFKNNTKNAKKNNCSFNEESLCQLATALKENCKLKELDFSYTFNAGISISPLMDMLSVNTSITKLDLSNNALGRNAQGSIGEMLKVNRSITALTLRSIGGKALELICAGLAVNSCVTNIDLSNNRFDHRHVSALAECLKVNRTISNVTLLKTIKANSEIVLFMGAFICNLTLQEFTISPRKRIVISDSDNSEDDDKLNLDNDYLENVQSVVAVYNPELDLTFT